MDALIGRVAECIGRYDLLRRREPVVLGLSGGVDSVVLGIVLLELGHPVMAVHVNFRLRGTASDDDEAFVRRWCRDRGVELVVRSFDTERVAGERGESVQEAARTLRYAAFEDAAHSAGCRKVALGHHRDDQAETLLLNLFRGTGPEGLAGMPRKRPIRPNSPIEVVRPLLDVRREEIEDYARDHGLTWRVDDSNLDRKYRRGALRRDILPLIERYFGGAATENIARSSDLVREYLEQSLQDELRAAFESSLSTAGEHGAVDLAAVRELPPVIRRRVFIEAMRRWLPDAEPDAAAAAEIEALLTSQPGRRLDFGEGSVWRERERLLFEPPVHRNQAVRRLDAGESLELPDGVLAAERLSDPPTDVTRGAPHDVYLDERAVQFPLTVRPWTPGDRFVPLGMSGEKKISDFLTDERVPPHRKRDVHVVESNGSVVWVVPLRIAHGARIRDDSVEAVRLRFTPHAAQAAGRADQAAK